MYGRILVPMWRETFYFGSQIFRCGELWKTMKLQFISVVFWLKNKHVIQTSLWWLVAQPSCASRCCNSCTHSTKFTDTLTRCRAAGRELGEVAMWVTGGGGTFLLFFLQYSSFFLSTLFLEFFPFSCFILILFVCYFFGPSFSFSYFSFILLCSFLLFSFYNSSFSF